MFRNKHMHRRQTGFAVIRHRLCAYQDPIAMIDTRGKLPAAIEYPAAFYPTCLTLRCQGAREEGVGVAVEYFLLTFLRVATQDKGVCTADHVYPARR